MLSGEMMPKLSPVYGLHKPVLVLLLLLLGFCIAADSCEEPVVPRVAAVASDATRSLCEEGGG